MGIETLRYLGDRNRFDRFTKALIMVNEGDCDGIHQRDFVLCAGCNKDLIEEYEEEAEEVRDGCRIVRVFYLDSIQEEVWCDQCDRDSGYCLEDFDEGENVSVLTLNGARGHILAISNDWVEIRMETGRRISCRAHELEAAGE